MLRKMPLPSPDVAAPRPESPQPAISTSKTAMNRAIAEHCIRRTIALLEAKASTNGCGGAKSYFGLLAHAMGFDVNDPPPKSGFRCSAWSRCCRFDIHSRPARVPHGLRGAGTAADSRFEAAPRAPQVLQEDFFNRPRKPVSLADLRIERPWRP